MCGHYGITRAQESPPHFVLASVTLLIATLLLAACDTEADPASLAWSDGCRAGRASADSPFSPTEPRDNEGFSTDPVYRQAWDSGFTVCRSRRLNSSRL